VSIELDLGNAAHWEQFHYSSRQVSWRNNYLFDPLEEIDCSGGTFLESSILASFANSTNAKSTWRIAGWLHQKIRVGVAVGGGLDAVSQHNSRVLLNRVKLHFWRRDIKSYGLSFAATNWMQQLNLTLWKYTGPVIDLTQEAIDLTRIDILRTEAKVDALFKDWTQ
jgi:hypothetical protein